MKGLLKTMQSKWKVLPLAILTALSLTACGGEKAEKVEPENKQVEVVYG